VHRFETVQRIAGTVCVFLAVGLWACAPIDPTPISPDDDASLDVAEDGTTPPSDTPDDDSDAPRPDEDVPAADGNDARSQDDTDTVDIAGAMDASDAEDGDALAPPVEDDATVEAVVVPTSIPCGRVATASITFRNTGAATWTRDAGYKLGTVDDSDPFYTRSTRVLLDDDVVTPGQAWTFEFELRAPDTEGRYTTDWRMVHEGVRWFGEASVHEIEVACEDHPPEQEPTLDAVRWLHTDVSDWSQTGTLSRVYVNRGQICLDYDKADVWPIYDLDGTEVVGNPWIFIWRDGTWYAGTWEWLRPGQTCKAISSVAGSHIKADPFGEHSGWIPTPGTTYWFMVSGLARFRERNIRERTNLVPFVWP
jgi:hypothetical protein